jgi:hypothetical protein
MFDGEGLAMKNQYILTTIVVSSSVDADEEKIITVQLDGEESTLTFIDPEDDEV